MLEFLGTLKVVLTLCQPLSTAESVFPTTKSEYEGVNVPSELWDSAQINAPAFSDEPFTTPTVFIYPESV